MAAFAAVALAGCGANSAGYDADIFCTPGTAPDLVQLDRARLTAGAIAAMDACAEHGSASVTGRDAQTLYVAGECCRYTWGNVTVTAQFTV